MQEILISIIIPCFNHGAYLQEAIDSVTNISGVQKKIEIIIVNDGSTDKYTIEKLHQLEKEGWSIITQKNSGLAAARNLAIKKARGKYIIPLDSDNRLTENYLTKGVQILESDPSIGIIYGNVQKFGMIEKFVIPSNFDIYSLIQNNYIDACTIFRKEIWVENDGYDQNMPAMGNEDWEFWINSFINGYKFYHLNELCFHYRVLPNSMTVTSNGPNNKKNREYIFIKHQEAIFFLWEQLRRDNARKSFILNYLKTHKLLGCLKVLLGYKTLYSK
jgi:glycosyltransferase involved in cell wall biosynthesis